jgi:hypothetical protein
MYKIVTNTWSACQTQLIQTLSLIVRDKIPYIYIVMYDKKLKHEACFGQ